MTIKKTLFDDLKSITASPKHKDDRNKKPYLRRNNIFSEIPKITFSKDQQKFLDAEDNKILLNALAGSGKTTLLMEYARLRPHNHYHFIVFNRSLYNDWKVKAPKNVSVNTVHQMAFHHFGDELKHKLTDEITINDLNKINSSIINLPTNDKEKQLYKKQLLIQFNHFLHSSTKEFSLDLIDSNAFNKLNQKHPDKSWDKSHFIDDLEVLWKHTLDKNKDFPITHDGYLKRFCMVEQSWMGSHWILDEAQDWSECFLDSFIRKTNNSIIAGDPYQRLYEEQNLLKSLTQNFSHYWLSHSFRSPEILSPWVNFYLNDLGCPHLWEGKTTQVLPNNNKLQQSEVIFERQNIQNIIKFAPNVIISSRWKNLEEVALLLKNKNIPYKFHNNYYQKKTISKSKTQNLDVILLSTIHSIKGMEFNNVWICDDIFKKEDNHQLQSILAYVALTRTLKKCRIPDDFNKREDITHYNSEPTDNLFESIF